MTTREKLEALTENLWWCWHPEVLSLFERLNPEAFQEANNNPKVALEHADENLLNDAAFSARVDAAHASLQGYLNSTATLQAPETAYFCMEFGLHESLPMYSGGLGVLAGDHSKAASDLGIPFTGIGLFLREGYFQQSFESDGNQKASFPAIDPRQHPIKLLRTDAGDPLLVEVNIAGTAVKLQAWKLELGRSTLFLLDSQVEANPDEFKNLTAQLYQGDNKNRIQQEIALGVGGLRLLRKLEIEPEVFHLNEGHSAFMTLELLREELQDGKSLPDAEAAVREQCVFTTHTPVPAGHDRFAPTLVTTQLAGLQSELGLSDSELLAYGREDASEPVDSGERFCMTVLGLKLSRHANGVSKRNGKVAQKQWTGLYPDREESDVPIGSITNGVHLPTWTAQPARNFLREHLGDWMAHRNVGAFWDAAEELPAEAIWELRSMLRKQLLAFAEKHTERQSLPQTPQFNPNALTIGFARRFATYKRATLIFSDLDRAARLFQNEEQPIQMLFAGKAHPADEGGKSLIKKIYDVSQQDPFKGKLIFLENYNMQIGRMLVSGSDVWLNNPRPPYEASGTSGQKTTLHAGLNCSILDGWWPEGYNGTNGWVIGEDSPLSLNYDLDQRDKQDAEALYSVLENEVIPEFYDRDEQGLPQQWIGRIRSAMKNLPAAYSAERMVADYLQEIYRKPAKTEAS